MSARPHAYRAFISYSHRDKAVAAWLHRAIEHYRVPKKLVGQDSPVGPVPHRLTPVFRDRDELPASGDLGRELTAALERALFLVVICSPASAKSRWVNEEILTFKRMHGEARLLALIADGEPGASADPQRAHLECFPPALRLRIGADGALTDVPAEPIAADMRKAADGKRLARLKILAGLSGVGLDALAQREAQRRTRRLVAVASGASLIAVATSLLALYANQQRIEAQRQRNIARQEAATAVAASDFLIDTFAKARPGARNPRDISAVDILDNSAKRARRELSGQPVVQARLLETLGRAYDNLGLPDQALASIEPALPEIRRAGPDGAGALLMLAQVYDGSGNSEQALATIDAARRLLGPDTPEHRRLRALAAFNEGRVLAFQGELKRAIAAFAQAERLFKTAPDGRPRDFADLYNNRGLALSEDGQHAAAARDLKHALALFRKIYGDDDLQTAFAWFALGANMAAAGDHARAEQQVARAIAIERRVLDPDNPILANALSLHGEILRNLKRLPEARAALAEAIAVYTRVYGEPHSLIGASNVYLGQVERDAGRLGAALAAFDAARRNYDGAYDREHPNQGELKVLRATVLSRAGRTREARAECEEGTAILNRTMGKDAAFTRKTVQLCATLQ